MLGRRGNHIDNMDPADNTSDRLELKVEASALALWTAAGALVGFGVSWFVWTSEMVVIGFAFVGFVFGAWLQTRGADKRAQMQFEQRREIAAQRERETQREIAEMRRKKATEQ